MRSLLFVPYYIKWHYHEALRKGVGLWRNFIWFTFHLFSVGLLLKTLFSPWQRIQDERKPGLDIGNILGTFAINFVLRIAGALIRLTVIGIGLFFVVLLFILGIACFFIWLVYPLIMIVLLIMGIGLLFK